jgi:hypothetical protein
LVAYLCLGYVEGFAEVPDLERDGWEKRAELAPLVRADYFDQTYTQSTPPSDDWPPQTTL